MNSIANTGRDIIEDMFRWGYINSNSKYIDLDLRSMSDSDVIKTILDMHSENLIGPVTEEYKGIYYVQENLINNFIDEHNYFL